MKKLILLFVVILGLAGCVNNGYNEGSDEQGVGQDEAADTVSVVASMSIIADMVSVVGGDLVTLHTLVPIGDDPHEHEVLPADMISVTNADVIFYNGLNLETGQNWFADLMDATDRVADVHYFAVSDGVDVLYLTGEDLEDYQDPHAWLDIRNGIIYVRNIARILSEVSPENADIFQENANAYIEKLQNLHDEWIGRFDDIPDSERLLVTTEGAFRYFGYAYNVNTAYVWEINAHDEGTPEQMIRIVGIVNETDVRYLFTESSIDTQYMEQVSVETGVAIFGTLFTDSLADGNDLASTYYGMMRHNLEMVYEALGNIDTR